MVHLIEVADKRGRKTWREDAPKRCPNGHEHLGAKWGQCPVTTCRKMGRLWDCREPGCDQVLVDDEHVHRGEVPPGVRRD